MAHDRSPASSSAVGFSAGLPETVLPPPPPELVEALARARSAPDTERRHALGTVAAAYPRWPDVWAELSERADDEVEGYAYARVGYHRGLDSLRASGWRGSGYVRWRSETNRGFLRCLDALRRRAGAIGELDEEQRCALFLVQLDPDWAHGPGAERDHGS